MKNNIELEGLVYTIPEIEQNTKGTFYNFMIKHRNFLICCSYLKGDKDKDFDIQKGDYVSINGKINIKKKEANYWTQIKVKNFSKIPLENVKFD